MVSRLRICRLLNRDVEVLTPYGAYLRRPHVNTNLDAWVAASATVWSQSEPV